MPVKIKRKAVSKNAPLTPKYERLRLREWMMFWILVAATLALVFAIFGNVDVNTLKPMSVVSDEQQAEEQAMVEELKAEVVNLQAMVQDAETVAAQPEKPFNRLCMTAHLAVSDKYLTFVDQKTGVSMTLPYAVVENSNGCLVPTISDDENGIAFGPLVDNVDGLDQDSFIRILPVTSTAAILKELKRRNSDQDDSVKNIRQRTINGLAVISHEATWEISDSARYWYAIGRNFSYQIGSLRALSDAEAIKIIQSLRVTK